MDNIQLHHLRIKADGQLPKLPMERPYALVLIAHEETSDRFRRAVTEIMATGSCVQANIWGEDAEDWQDCTEAANAFAIMTEERSETIPDIVVSSQSNRAIDDVFAFASAHMNDLEIEGVDLMITLEIGRPAFRYDLTSMAHRAAADYGMQAALAC
ncbi:hypothetical protein HCZ30_09295 [Marivivens donghaensis]|uniref:DUF7684 domain-containing protein n=1 Tax=Marivivens donghaensis TaxID=1699413 RepID=A0ABX0VX21_9RHOB|nr:MULTISPECIES: hypothetical protein [Marivivens]NIY72629.1 hypothetical protein [Marivivens donghaensis]